MRSGFRWQEDVGRSTGNARIGGRDRGVQIQYPMRLPLHILQLLLGHPKIVPQFMYESLSDLVSDFSLIRADRLNVFLVKHDVIRSRGQVEDASLRRRHAVKDA